MKNKTVCPMCQRKGVIVLAETKERNYLVKCPKCGYEFYMAGFMLDTHQSLMQKQTSS